jgi:hypothetical protein
MRLPTPALSALSVLAFITVPALSAPAAGTKQIRPFATPDRAAGLESIDSWLTAQLPASIQGLTNNIGPSGFRGAVCASPVSYR